MLELFIYPISGIMKMWHSMLHSGFGLDDSMAWILSLFGLVITIRSITIPLTWLQMKSGRIAVLIRPKDRALKDTYANRHDASSIKEHEEKVKELRSEYGYSLAAGCLPSLILFPAFLGLYQVLLRMSRPAEGIDADHFSAIGFLTSDDVRAFLQTKIGDIPIAAYTTLTTEQLSLLGATKSEIREFIFPLIIASCVFTLLNMLISIYRTWVTLDADSAAAVFALKLIVISAIIMPFVLYGIGMYGPIPVAIILYWVANNLWTLIQSIVVALTLYKVLPLEEEHLHFLNERRQLLNQRRKQKREFKRRKRNLRLKKIYSAEARKEYREFIAQHKAERAAKKAERSKHSALRTEAQKELRQQRAAEKKAKKEAAKKEKEARD
ncbi:membrane protein insertase YidC [Corynebacterium kutscheri]|uniref:membrane protein insertase YidC n=1 Tax=Corynebacterium kutscheri TaxID=35755 RepID=UPI0011E4CCEA|nr:membrane protein insertase YidC [Corynebacterium kutscheri]